MKAQTGLVVTLWTCAMLQCGIAQNPSNEKSLRGVLDEFFQPPQEYVNDLGDFRSPLKFYDGVEVKSSEDWQRRRREILDRWHGIMGPWPPLIEKPQIEYVKTERRENFTQHQVRVEMAVGLGKELRDFGYQLAKRGFVTLSIGALPPRRSRPDEAAIQRLFFEAYAAANCHTALAMLPNVDPQRIGIVGHSFGGKWAMFASCLYDKFACAAWSDGGVVFDETRGNVNYWEPWYLGEEIGRDKQRTPGVPNQDNPRTGACKRLVEAGLDLHELHALMAPRPFLVSGGAEDQLERWRALNHAIAVNQFLGFPNRVAMTNRTGHAPTADSNEQIYHASSPGPRPQAVDLSPQRPPLSPDRRRRKRSDQHTDIRQEYGGHEYKEKSMQHTFSCPPFSCPQLSFRYYALNTHRNDISRRQLFLSAMAAIAGSSVRADSPSTFHVESRTRFRLSTPHYLDMDFCCRAHQNVFQHGDMSMFWASYMNAPEDKSICFLGGLDTDRDMWTQFCNQWHDDQSTVRHRDDQSEMTFPEGGRSALFKSLSRMRFDLPFFYGHFDDLVCIVMFDRSEGIGFTHSPSGGDANGDLKTKNPAWDFQFLVQNPELMKDYGFKVRTVLRPMCSRDEILAEFSLWKQRQ